VCRGHGSPEGDSADGICFDSSLIGLHASPVRARRVLRSPGVSTVNGALHYSFWAKSGFSSEDKHTKVVAWTGINHREIAPGQFKRIAFLRDSVVANVDVNLDLIADTAGVNRVPGDFYMPSGPGFQLFQDENILCAEFPPIAPGVIGWMRDVRYLGETYRYLARPAKTQLRDFEDAQGVPIFDAPSYLSLRGVTLGLDTAEWRVYYSDDVRNTGLYNALSYWGEGSLSGTYPQAALSELPRRFSHLKEAPPLIATDQTPQPVERLYFGAAPAYRDPIILSQAFLCESPAEYEVLFSWNRPADSLSWGASPAYYRGVDMGRSYLTRISPFDMVP
jgi:hypothetical protein